MSKGPVSKAAVDLHNAAIVIADSTDQIVVVDFSRLAVFNLVIQTSQSGLVLNKIKVYVNGLYDPAILADLKLYHQGMQLGQMADIDEQGYIYFDAAGYKLPVGQNEFSILLASNQYLAAGDILQFSLEDAQAVFLSYQDHVFTAQGDFPVTGGLISFIEKGSISAYNNFKKTDFLAASREANQIASFILNNTGEMIDLRQIVVGYQSDQNLSTDQIFTLSDDSKTVAISKPDSDSQQIVFILDKPVVLAANKSINLKVYAFDLPVGVYDFHLIQAQGLGFASGQDIEFSEQLFLSRIEVRDHFPEFDNGESNKALSSGWNTLFNLKVKARGQDNVSLNKLSWRLDSYGVEISEVEIWANNQFEHTDLIINEGQITANWPLGLSVSPEGTDIKLLIKADQVESSASLQIYLLDDKSEASDNLIWSYNQQYHNSYLLPYLPLNPNILSN